MVSIASQIAKPPHIPTHILHSNSTPSVVVAISRAHCYVCNHPTPLCWSRHAFNHPSLGHVGHLPHRVLATRLHCCVLAVHLHHVHLPYSPITAIARLFCDIHRRDPLRHVCLPCSPSLWLLTFAMAILLVISTIMALFTQVAYTTPHHFPRDHPSVGLLRCGNPCLCPWLPRLFGSSWP